MAPGMPKPTEKKGGRKRKAVDDEEAEVAAKTVESSKKLDFVKKPGSSQAAGLGAAAARELPREGDEMEETQFEETQETQSRNGSRLNLVDEEEEEELEDTQVETQVDESVSFAVLS